MGRKPDCICGGTLPHGPDEAGLRFGCPLVFDQEKLSYMVGPEGRTFKFNDDRDWVSECPECFGAIGHARSVLTDSGVVLGACACAKGVPQ